MQRLTPFAQTPTTPEPIIAQIRRQLAEDDRFGRQIPGGVIDRVADRAVRELWGSPVKTFVPILALRQAQEILREQDVVISAPRAAVRHIESAPTAGRVQDRAAATRCPLHRERRAPGRRARRVADVRSPIPPVIIQLAMTSAGWEANATSVQVRQAVSRSSSSIGPVEDLRPGER